MAARDSNDENWRLRADIHGLDGREHRDRHEHLDRLIKRLREDSSGLAGGLRDQVLMTHDGNTLFGYAFTLTELRSILSAIEAQLASDGRAATITLAHWDAAESKWQQLDASGLPIQGGEAECEGEGERERAGVDGESQSGSDGDVSASTAAERTFVVVVGRLERNAFEWDIVNYITAHDLSYRMVEHRHLLSTQVAFHVSGPAEKLDELDRYIKREARRTFRVDPGLVPYGVI
ncbi:MAG TPA: hypothetical protein VLJ42_03715 [Solirubrobacteraceae bacterium]|nr:hypothetical protein [Solirubrobacteraceae bacterium]